MILYGIGKATCRDFVDSTKILALAKLQDLNIDFTGNEEKVSGGDSPYAFASFAKDKAISVSATNAKFDLSMLEFTQGASVTTGAVAFEEQEEYVIPDDGIIMLEQTPSAGSLQVLGFTKGTTTPTVGQYVQDGTDAKKLTFHADDYGKEINVIYSRQSGATTKTISVLKDTFSKPFKFTHRIPIYDDNNTIVAQGQLVIFKCKANNKFNFSLKPQTAFAPKIEFEAQDPKRSDKKLWDFSIEEVTA